MIANARSMRRALIAQMRAKEAELGRRYVLSYEQDEGGVAMPVVERARPDTAVKEPEEFEEKDWAEKIERAKEAREAGRELRRGKPAAFGERRGAAWKTR